MSDATRLPSCSASARTGTSVAATPDREAAHRQRLAELTALAPQRAAAKGLDLSDFTDAELNRAPWVYDFLFPELLT